jgi:hypothetical protein
MRPSPRVSALTPTPRANAGTTEAWAWPSQIAPCQGDDRHHHATASWPPTRPWNLEGGVATPWLQTMPQEQSPRELGMSVLACAAAHSSRTRRRVVGALWHGGYSFFLHQEVLRGRVVVLDDLNHRVDQENRRKNLKPSPLPGTPNVGEEILRPSGGMHPP